MSRWGKRALAVVVLTAGLGLAPSPATAAVPVLVLDGTGFGHGVGLSQWGAEYLARTGRSTEQILATFYPGAELAQGSGPVRVVVHSPGASTTTLSFPAGGEVRSAPDGAQAPGFPVRVGRGGQVRITFDGAYRVTPLVTGQAAARATTYRSEPCALLVLCPPPTTAPPSTTTTTAPPTTRPGGGSGGGAGGGGGSTPPPASPPPSSPGTVASSPSPVLAVPNAGGVTRVDDRGRSYRGVVEAGGAGALRLVNIIDIEDYLRGMAEVPSTWPPAAVQAQTVAARTYALRAVQASGELCDDARCQVYQGAGAESPGQNAAVAATAARVLSFGGRLAAAVYSADAGGVSANTFEGFGTPDGTYPYLRNVRYETDNPLPWHVVVGLGDLAGRFGYPGAVTGVTVAEAGPSGRALSLVLHGAAGDRTVDGHQFARGLGLRSTRFTAALGTADGTPLPPPPSEEPIQALPDDTGSLARHPLAPPMGLRLDRSDQPSSYAVVAPSLPESLDPRRHPMSLVAILLAAFVAGGHVPVLMARPPSHVRAWARWRLPTRHR